MSVIVNVIPGSMDSERPRKWCERHAMIDLYYSESVDATWGFVGVQGIHYMNLSNRYYCTCCARVLRIPICLSAIRGDRGSLRSHSSAAGRFGRLLVLLDVLVYCFSLLDRSCVGSNTLPSTGRHPCRFASTSSGSEMQLEIRCARDSRLHARLMRSHRIAPAAFPNHLS